MRKNTSIIESYVYAKQLNKLCLKLEEKSNLTNDNFFISSRKLSKNLLTSCEKLLTQKKHNNLSFLILKNSISNTIFFEEFNKNYTLLIKMMNKYVKYFNQIKKYT